MTRRPLCEYSCCLVLPRNDPRCEEIVLIGIETGTREEERERRRLGQEDCIGGLDRLAEFGSSSVASTLQSKHRKFPSKGKDIFAYNKSLDAACCAPGERLRAYTWQGFCFAEDSPAIRRFPIEEDEDR